MILPERIINNLIDSPSFDVSFMSDAGLNSLSLPKTLAWGVSKDSNLLRDNGRGLIYLCDLICINTRYNTDSIRAFKSVCALIREHCSPSDEDIERIGMAAFSNCNYMGDFLSNFKRRAVKSIAFSASLITDGFLRDAPYKVTDIYYDALNKYIMESPDEAALLLQQALDVGRLSIGCISKLISHTDFLKANPLLSSGIKNSFFTFMDTCLAGDVKSLGIINEVGKIISSPLVCDPPMVGKPERDVDIERFLIKTDCEHLYDAYASKHLIGSGKNGQRWPGIVEATLRTLQARGNFKETVSYFRRMASAIYTLDITKDEINELITAHLDLIEKAFLSGEIESGASSSQNQFFGDSIKIKERLKSSFSKLDDSVAIRWDRIFSKCMLENSGGMSPALLNPYGSSGLAGLLINRVSTNPLNALFLTPPSSPPKWYKSIEAEISIGLGVHWSSLSERAEHKPNLINKVKALLNEYVDHCYGVQRCYAIELIATAVGLNWLFSDYEKDGAPSPGYLSKRGLEYSQLCHEPGLIKGVEDFLSKNDSIFFKALYSAENGYSSAFEYPKEGTQFYNFVQYLLASTPGINNIDIENMPCTEISERLHTVYGPGPINLSSPLVYRVERLVNSLSNDKGNVSAPKRRGP